MNAFFQALLSRFLREHLVDAELLDEHRLRGVFFYDPRHNPCDRRAPIPRPDFLVRRGLRTLAILDAKYRDLWLRPLPREMLYQLAIYALTRPADEASATILYPTLSDGVEDQVIGFRDVLGGTTKARVTLRPVHLLVLDGLLRAGSTLDAVRRRQAMASRLVAGHESGWR
jgi:5-methylcytosine-specific restriction enzyme subunit McrC